MKAVDTNLLELLKKSERFVVPIYQRVYSWGEAECSQLWDDILRAGARDSLNNHFTGSIVYIERDQGTRTSREPDLIIDGQQRVTTVTLLLAALAARLELLPEDQREPVAGFAPQKIRGLYLTNAYESGEEFFKLTLSQRDQDALKAVVRNSPLPETDSRVVANYEYFVQRLHGKDIDLGDICRGLDKLVVVDVKLTRGSDDPQLVFESMNATGKKLSQADLIRNFVLMDLQPAEQTRLYEDYWFPMEQRFEGSNERRFDEFVRHFLTVKTGVIPRLDDIYEAFKNYSFSEEERGRSRETLVTDLSRQAEWFANMALGFEPRPELAQRFIEVDLLATVVYPFQLQVYADYARGDLSVEDFTRILDAEIAYVFRRNVCGIATNSLNKTFATLFNFVDRSDYATSVCARLVSLPDYRRFPTDEEFEESLKKIDLYHSQRRSYFFRKMENSGRKELVSTAEYTIEHIMPQHATEQWRRELGPEWQEVHDRYLHTLGNLTLTGYNPEYSDRPFVEKRDMEGGFKHSPLRLNAGLGELTRWNADTMEARADRLARLAVTLWARPDIGDEVLQRFAVRFNDGRRFDWSQMHAILEDLPAGRWTSYYNLAEAVGTGAQALANHVSKCGQCVNAYRVLTWDGRVADDFHWHDQADSRDPVRMLEEEGLRFLPSGKADPDQQLTVDELMELGVEADA